MKQDRETERAKHGHEKLNPERIGRQFSLRPGDKEQRDHDPGRERSGPEHRLHQTQKPGDRVPDKNVAHRVRHRDARDHQHHLADEDLVFVKEGDKVADRPDHQRGGKGDQEVIDEPSRRIAGQFFLQKANKQP